jgi:hypothetical protein
MPEKVVVKGRGRIMGSSWVAEHFFSLLDMGLAALCLVVAFEALPIAVGGYLGAFGLLAFIPLGLVTMAVQRIKRSEPPRGQISVPNRCLFRSVAISRKLTERRRKKD